MVAPLGGYWKPGLETHWTGDCVNLVQWHPGQSSGVEGCGGTRHRHPHAANQGRADEVQKSAGIILRLRWKLVAFPGEQDMEHGVKG